MVFALLQLWHILNFKKIRSWNIPLESNHHPSHLYKTSDDNEHGDLDAVKQHVEWKEQHIRSDKMTS